MKSLCFAALLSASLLFRTNGASAGDAAYQPPRLPNGRVDMQGLWAHLNSTPLERPRDITTHLIDAQQAGLIEAHIADSFDAGGEPTEFYDERRIELIDGKRHSSLITDPEDGRVPWNDGSKDLRQAVFAALFSAYDGPEARPLEERCLIGPGGPPIAPYPVNNLHQIVQTQNAIVIASEALHEARIVRLNAKHAPESVVSWLGDSIGWWDGDTLVIETRHFSPASRDRFLPHLLYFVSPTTMLIERLSRTSEDELRYVFTISDPAFYTRSWTGETRLRRSSDRSFEVACHEGNYALRFILEGARAQEARGKPVAGGGELR